MKIFSLKKSVEVFHMCQQQGHVFLYRHELEHRRTRKKTQLYTATIGQTVGERSQQAERKKKGRHIHRC
jgi:hypothetical protein